MDEMNRDASTSPVERFSASRSALVGSVPLDAAAERARQAAAHADQHFYVVRAGAGAIRRIDGWTAGSLVVTHAAAEPDAPAAGATVPVEFAGLLIASMVRAFIGELPPHAAPDEVERSVDSLVEPRDPGAPAEWTLLASSETTSGFARIAATSSALGLRASDFVESDGPVVLRPCVSFELVARILAVVLKSS